MGPAGERKWADAILSSQPLNQSTMANHNPGTQDSGGCPAASARYKGSVVMSTFERSASAPAGFRIEAPARAGDFQAALLDLAGHDLRQPLQIIQATYDLLRTHVRTEA